MTVLHIDVAEPSHRVAIDTPLPAQLNSPTLATSFRDLHHIAVTELPNDVENCEVSFIICFRASQMLNYVMGRDPRMTFSARIWRSRRTARRVTWRMVWGAVWLIVDFACLVIRAERNHCRSAWINYVRRPGRIRL